MWYDARQNLKLKFFLCMLVMLSLLSGELKRNW